MIISDAYVSVETVEMNPQVARSLKDLLDLANPENIPSGIFYWSMMRPNALMAHDGEIAAGPVDQFAWEQMIHDLHVGAVGPSSIQSVAALKAAAAPLDGDGTVKIALANVAYHTYHPRLAAKVLLAQRTAVPLDLPSKPEGAIVERRAFIASALLHTNYDWIEAQPHIHRGLTVDFLIDQKMIINNTGEAITDIAVDFDDGEGFHSLSPGQQVSVTYVEPARKTVRLTANTNGTRRSAVFYFTVSDETTPQPNATWYFETQYGGQMIKGQAYVFYGKGNTQLRTPVILADGFPGNHSLDYLWSNFNKQNLARNLLDDGKDLIILTYPDGTVWIQALAQIAVACIQKAIQSRVGNDRLVVGGVSMGGLVTRYALCWMQTNGIDPQTQLYFTYDTPHNGAEIPFSVQCFVHFFRSQSPQGEVQAQILSSVAAQQMLYLWTPSYDYAGSSGDNPNKIAFRNELWSLGWMPSMHKIAVANGTGNGAQNGINSGALAVNWHGNACVHSELYTTPSNGTSSMVWNGYCIKVDFWKSYKVSLTCTQALDSAPGGLRDSFKAVAQAAKDSNYGWVDTNYENHCFVPSVSALAITCSNDLFYKISDEPCTSFNAVKWSTNNTMHVDVTAELAQWLLQEVNRMINDVEVMLA